MKRLDTGDLCGKKTDRGFNMTTASGKPFWPADPRPEDIRIEDIAAHLSRICRFNGAIKDGDWVAARPWENKVWVTFEVYSVAQHSILVCEHVCDPALRLPALLHDAPEYIVGDMIKPIKMMHPERKAQEKKLAVAIGQRFGIDPELFDHPAVKMQDYRAVLTEHRDLQVCTDEVDWGLDQAKEKPWPEQIVPVLPSVARAQFLELFYRLYKGN